MSGLATALLVLTAGLAAALPSSNHGYVLHESRAGTQTSASHASSGHWKRGSPAEADAILPLRIGLTQTGLHSGYGRLMEVSHPSSPSYGQHLTSEEVHELFAPADGTVAAVRAWLIESGVEEGAIMHYENRGWLGVDLPVREAERLFQTRYHEHERNGQLRVGCDEYYVPGHLVEHIDYISPGVKLSAPMRKKRSVTRRAIPALQKRKKGYGPQKLAPGAMPDWRLPPAALGLPPELRGCALNFTTPCYRALYGIPAVNPVLPGNEVGIYESGDTYSQEDLDLYFSRYAPYIPNGTHPQPAFIDGAEAPVPVHSPFNTGESDIDNDIIWSLVWPQRVVLYQTDDGAITANDTYEGFLNTFLDALDGSYCNYTAFGITGDSPGIDPTYPDPRPGGYKGPLMCGAYRPTRVVSISYGESELDVPKRYLERQCSEFLKLGLQGHTFLVSSGDYGVASYPGDNSTSGCLSGGGQNQTIYNPGNPVSCPFLTAVGATQLQPNQTIKDPESAMQTALGTGGLSRFASAGGFSNYFPVPAYQKAAVGEYLARHNPGHPSYVANADASNIGAGGGIYNRAGRGIPDVSANGVNFRAYMNGTDYHWYGTSLAAPLWASVVTLLNTERQLVGKGPVGFINPVLYENAWALTDIKNGSNPNCGSSGFHAVDGWDPITGLGTPKYSALLDLFLGLP